MGAPCPSAVADGTWDSTNLRRARSFDHCPPNSRSGVEYCHDVPGRNRSRRACPAGLCATWRRARRIFRQSRILEGRRLFLESRFLAPCFLTIARLCPPCAAGPVPQLVRLHVWPAISSGRPTESLGPENSLQRELEPENSIQRKSLQRKSICGRPFYAQI